MLAKKYRSEVVSVENPIGGIYTIEFAPLGGRYKFLPGQFLHVALDEEYDGSGQWPESRCFSIRSSPDDMHIKITYAVKGAFTQQMEKSLKPGREVWLKLPYGDLFQQPHSKAGTVFIAGGTGITPFLSLFSHSSFEQYIAPKIYLGFRSSAYDIYKEELAGCKNTGKQISIFYQDETGVIDIQRIFRENAVEATYFISGPPAMIKSFKKTLADHGVPETRILTDDWA